MSPTSHFDQVDQTVTSPRDGPRNLAPHANMPMQGIGVRQRNDEIKRKSFLSRKKQSTISNISVQKPLGVS